MCITTRHRRSSEPIALAIDQVHHVLNTESNYKHEHSCSSLQTEKRVPKKRISFFERVQVRTHLHVNDYDESEKDATWYSQKELRKIQRKNHKILKKLNSCIDDKCMKQGIHSGHITSTTCLIVPDESERYCFRGLEGATTLGGYLRQQHKSAAWNGVEWEQHRQWQLQGYVDPDNLASVYHNEGGSEECAKVAHEWALHDEIAALSQECDDVFMTDLRAIESEHISAHLLETTMA